MLHCLPELRCAQDPGERDAVPLHQTPAHRGDGALPARCVQRTRQPVDHLPLRASNAVSQQKLAHVSNATHTLDTSRTFRDWLCLHANQGLSLTGRQILVGRPSKSTTDLPMEGLGILIRESAIITNHKSAEVRSVQEVIGVLNQVNV